MKKYILIPSAICLLLIILSGFFFYKQYVEHVEARKELLVEYVSVTKTKMEVIMSRVRELPHIVMPVMNEKDLVNADTSKYRKNISMLKQFYIDNNYFIRGISIYNNFGDVFSLYRDKDSTFIHDIYKPRNVKVLRSSIEVVVENKSFSIVLPLYQNYSLAGNVEVDIDMALLQRQLFQFCFEKSDLWLTSVLDEETAQTLPLGGEWVLLFENDLIKGVLDRKTGFFQGKIKGLRSSYKVVTYYESLKVPEQCLGIAFSSNISPLITSSILAFVMGSMILLAMTIALIYFQNRMNARNRKALDEKDRRIDLLQTVYGNAPVAFIVYRNNSFFTANDYFFKLFDGVAALDDNGKVNFPFGFKREFEDWDVCTFEKKGKEIFLGRRQMDMRLDEDRFSIDAFWDITEMEQRLKETVRSDIAKSELLNRVCSDIKKALNSTVFMPQLMDHPSEETQLVLLDQSTTDLTGVIDVIQDYANIEAGRVTLEEVPFNLVEEIKKLTDKYQPITRQKGIELRAEIAASAIRNVVGDPMRFNQIINELLFNAIKYTHEGVIRLSLETTELQGRKILIKCSVEDSGQGMPKEKLKKLFSLDLRDKQEDESIGLGVIITKKLVNMMGGVMRVSSPSPVSTNPLAPGMQFSFSIICFSDHLSDKILDFSSVMSYGEINVLIVTSDHHQMQPLIELLYQKGIHSDTYIYKNDAEDLLINKLVIDKTRYHAVVIGTSNSDMTFSIAEEIHRNDLTEHCLYVLVDVYSQKGNYIKAKSLNMDYYFVKSNDLSIYDSILKKHFSHLSDEGISKAELVRKDLQILFAENNILSQKIAKLIFTNLGFENIDFASNELNLISQLNKKKYDVIFIDLKLPSSDAFNVAEVLRLKNYQMPIIAMTSTLSRENIKHIEDSKMDGFLTKPINPNNIKKILIKWFV